MQRAGVWLACGCPILSTRLSKSSATWRQPLPTHLIDGNLMAAIVPFLPWIAAAGGVVSAYAAVQQGQATRRAADYNAAVAQQNAVTARNNAAVDEQRQRMLARQTLGRARANYAASGVTMEGSPEDVLAESATQAEWDALL